MLWQSKSFALLPFYDFCPISLCKGFIVTEAWNLALFIDEDPFSMSFIGSSHSLFDCLGLNMGTYIGNLGAVIYSLWILSLKK